MNTAISFEESSHISAQLSRINVILENHSKDIASIKDIVKSNMKSIQELDKFKAQLVIIATMIPFVGSAIGFFLVNT